MSVLKKGSNQDEQNCSFDSNISYSRLADQISEDDHQSPRLDIENASQNALDPPSHWGQNSQKQFVMHNDDGPNIQINFLNGNHSIRNSNSEKIKIKDQKQQSHVSMSEHTNQKHQVSQVNHAKKVSLSSIKEIELEYKRSDDQFFESHPQNMMLQSMVLSSKKCQSIFPVSNIKKSTIARRMSSTARPEVSPIIQPDFNEVYIRPIDDSREIDLENHMQKNLQQDLQTLKILPQTNQKMQFLKSSQEGRAILSSLVTQSQKHPKISFSNNSKQEKQKKLEAVNSAGNLGQQKMFEKINKLEELIRELQEKRKSPKVSSQKSNSVTVKNKVDPDPEEQIMIKNYEKLQSLKGSDLKMRKWHQIAIFNLQGLLHNKIWNSIEGIAYPNAQFRQNILVQVLQFLQCSGFSIKTNRPQQITAKLSHDIWVILTASQFFIGKAKEKNQKIIKIKGLKLCPRQYAYSGQFNHNRKSGEGRILFQNNSSYSGNWQKDTFEGSGILTSQKGDIYTGNFQFGLKSGKGKEVFQRGDNYQGHYFNNLFHGHGTYIWLNGAYYKGEFRKGRMHGHGHWFSSKGDQYVGQFVDNVKDGWGIYKWKTGKVYEGYFQNGYQIDDSEENHVDKIHQRKSSFKFKRKQSAMDFSEVTPFRGRLRKSSLSHQKFRIFFQ